MFQNWGFLLGEIWVLILLAALLGLLAGWMIWNRSKELLGLRGDLESRDRDLASLKGRFGDLEAENQGYQTRFSQMETDYHQAISEKDAALTDLEGENQGLRIKYSQIETDHDSAIGRITELETEQSGLNSRIGLLANVETERDDAHEAKAKAQSGHATEIRRVRDRDEEITKLKSELAKSKAAAADVSGLQAGISSRDTQIASLTKNLTAAKSMAASASEKDGQMTTLTSQLEQCRATVATRDKTIADLKNQVSQVGSDYDGDGVAEGKNEGTKPQTLTAARGGKADDLKMIKGVGPKMEGLLHKLGFFHFDQVASWTDQEVAWVDANLEGFNGRVSRDRWIEQAKILAAGGTTEFAERVEDGGVYE